jgi:hypothetical protein
MYYVLWIDALGIKRRSGGFFNKQTAVNEAVTMRGRGRVAWVEDGRGNRVTE